MTKPLTPAQKAARERARNKRRGLLTQRQRPVVAPRSVYRDGELPPENPRMPTSQPHRGQMILPGMPTERTPTSTLTRWEDYTPDQQKAVKRYLYRKYGITQRDAQAAIHEHLTNAFAARAPGEHYAEGQLNYQNASGTEGAEVHQIAQRHGVSPAQVAVVRASLSSNVPVSAERAKTHVAFDRAAGAKSPDEIDSMDLSPYAEKERSARGMRGAFEEGSRAAFQLLHEGESPALRPNAFKQQGYAESFAHPHGDFTRMALDRWNIRAMAPRLTPEQHLQIQKVDAYSHPGIAEWFFHQNEQAAHKHGLTPAETQSIVWHQVRGHSASETDPRAAQKSRRAAERRYVEQLNEHDTKPLSPAEIRGGGRPQRLF